MKTRHFRYTSEQGEFGPVSCYVGPDDAFYEACMNIADGNVRLYVPGVSCEEVSEAEYDWAYSDVDEGVFGRYGEEEFIC